MPVLSLENKKVVEVFKTDVESFVKAQSVTRKLKELLPQAKINFDLDDCDHILRIEALHSEVDVHQIVDYINSMGIEIEVLS